jgi:ABC-type microcin C transport system permease subunit YejB
MNTNDLTIRHIRRAWLGSTFNLHRKYLSLVIIGCPTSISISMSVFIYTYVLPFGVGRAGRKGIARVIINIVEWTSSTAKLCKTGLCS